MRADRCCSVLHSTWTRERTWNQTYSTQKNDTNNISIESRARSEGDATFEKLLDPIERSPATGKSVAGIIHLFVEDLFETCGTEMEQRVPARLRKDFHVGSEDWNDVLFTGRRIRWMKDPQLEPSIEVSQKRAIEELKKIPVEMNTKEDLHCTPTMQTRNRSFVGQMNWLQSSTLFQCCYKFS